MIMTIPRSKITVDDDSRIDDNSYQPTRKEQEFKIFDALRVLSNNTLVCLGLILIGIQAAWAVELTFLVIYLGNLGFSVLLSGVASHTFDLCHYFSSIDWAVL